ncbi:MAG: phospholipase D-like domain-containing protein [Candidatus Thermoplasmatota archaeon]|nr:phospholipase D-like domain-containing protein [Candidatus Thermoplasmatota archaeon]
MSKKNLHLRLSLLIFILFFIFLLTNQIVFSGTKTNIVINEIMYNPEQNDNYSKWIELYNPTNQSINISGWSITDNTAEDTLEGDFEHGNGTTIIPPYSYALIADHDTKIYENFSIPNNAIKLYVDDLTIGNGLGNNKDKLILKDSNGKIIDAVEWGDDYPDVPGSPANLIDEGHSLCRYIDSYNNDSSIDFYDGTKPTPGEINCFLPTPNLKIDLFPRYIPKIQNGSTYSIPFAVKVNLSNYLQNESYQIKAFVKGDHPNEAYATQTWDGNKWIYSNYYVYNITTDEKGNWSGWMYLRFKKDYVEYQRNIENNNTAYVTIKIRKENSTYKTPRKVFLLDMDNSTFNGTAGGLVVGIAEKNNTCLQNKTVLIENDSGVITGLYFTESNMIDDGLVSKPGYFKITSPVGSNYKIMFLDENGSIIHVLSNLTIEQGRYKVDVYSHETFYLVRRNSMLDIPLTITNEGDFQDTLDIEIKNVSCSWRASLRKYSLTLKPKEKYDTYLYVIPCQQHDCKGVNITVVVTSSKDVGETDVINLRVDLLAPDLTIPNIKIYDERDKENDSAAQGETIRIKAYLRNIGNENASDVYVNFYYDNIDREHFIGQKYYDSVGKYQKYPSVEWDTIKVKPGSHTVFVIVDEEDEIDELDESNNQLSIKINIYDTRPSEQSKKILITEVYYHTHPSINNEFIKIHNPSDTNIDISGWYLTNQPFKNKMAQTKIVFPENTTLLSNQSILVTQNATAYFWETGKKPDFEHYVDSDEEIPQMYANKKFVLANKGAVVALKNMYNHTIDVVAYGLVDVNNLSGWNGSTVPDSKEGVILKRVFRQGLPVDTDTFNDWVQPRKYGIGQTDLPYLKISGLCNITTFVSPDCSYDVIVNELRKANTSIYFNIYEFTNPFLCNELIEALKRNVSVKIFAEGSPVGGMDDREKFILKKILDHGGEVRLIVNDKAKKIYARYTFDHGKYLVIDNKTVIVESCNWAKTGVPVDPSFGNRDWGIVIRNKDVAEYFLNVFMEDYNPVRCDSVSFSDYNYSLPPDFYMDETVIKGIYTPSFRQGDFSGNFSVTPVFSPDTSYDAICDMIKSANNSIYIQQMYIYRDWDDRINPFVELLVNKSLSGVDVKVILNYNPNYEDTNIKCVLTKRYFEKYGIEVKFIFTNWSCFTNIHNKGMIVDNKSVLISSVNWNENSVVRNREAGVIIENEAVAGYYVNVFFYDWDLDFLKISSLKSNSSKTGFSKLNFSETDLENAETPVKHQNTIYIMVIFTMTFVVIARDWRKRKWE